MVRGRHELEATILELRRELTEQQRSYGEAHLAMQANIQKLSKELVEEKKKPRPQSPKKMELPPPPKKKGGSPLGNFDLDEGPDALPISVQLANALKKGAGKVLDLFRSWDENGDGEVSREEFHLAMPALGLDVPKADIDKLFSEWDSDGGGCIGYKELSKILKAKPVAKSAAPAAAALRARRVGLLRRSQSSQIRIASAAHAAKRPYVTQGAAVGRARTWPERHRGGARRVGDALQRLEQSISTAGSHVRHHSGKPLARVHPWR
jgi:hypothetical protein